MSVLVAEPLRMVSPADVVCRPAAFRSCRPPCPVVAGSRPPAESSPADDADPVPTGHLECAAVRPAEWAVDVLGR